MSNNMIIDHQNNNNDTEPMIVDDIDNGSLETTPRRPALARSSGARRRLVRQLSECETPQRDAAWERRRRQNLRQAPPSELTDEDLRELKGCIELGFGFNEEDGQGLCETLPALDLYFAINRQVSLSPVSTPRGRASTSSSSSAMLVSSSLSSSSSSLLSSSSSLSMSSSIGRSNSPVGSPRADSEAWKICNPGDDPEQVKTKLRHWAQAVACSVMQTY